MQSCLLVKPLYCCNLALPMWMNMVYKELDNHHYLDSNGLFLGKESHCIVNILEGWIRYQICLCCTLCKNTVKVYRICHYLWIFLLQCQRACKSQKQRELQVLPGIQDDKGYNSVQVTWIGCRCMTRASVRTGLNWPQLISAHSSTTSCSHQMLNLSILH